jgi:hypothetical protein
MGEGDVKRSEAEARAELGRLRLEHHDLDAAISALEATRWPDSLQVRRLKKRKLALKERIAYLEDQINPDIIA